MTTPDTNTPPEKFSPEEARTLLTSVFGEGIIGEEKEQPGEKDPSHIGRWHLYYTGETVSLNADIPDDQRAQLAYQLRGKIRVSRWDKNKDGQEYTPEQIRQINGEIDQCLAETSWINLSSLYNLQAQGIKAQFQLNAWMNEVTAYEADWIAYKDFVSKKVSRLILGNDNGFRVTRQRETHQYALELNLRWGPVGLERYPELKIRNISGRDYISPYDMQDFYNRQGKELGVIPFIAYDSLHIGGHGAIDEELIIIKFRSAEDMTLKLHKLETDHDFCDRVRSFVARVMKDVSAEWVMPPMSPEDVNEINVRCPKPEGLYKPEMREALHAFWAQRESIVQEIEQRPKNIIWKQLAEKAKDRSGQTYLKGMTAGDLLHELKNPPVDADDVTRQVYAEVWKMIDSKLPFLTRRMENPKTDQHPRISGSEGIHPV